MIETSTAARCTKCGETKPRAAFTASKGKRNGLQSWCKACCAAAASRRWRRDNLPPAPPTDRLCGRCRLRKPLSEFSATHWQCRPCAAEYARERRRADPLKPWRAQLRRYNLTIEAYQDMLRRQGGVCALCLRPPGRIRLHVDHDHACCPGTKNSCGKCVRGLVCFPCNGRLLGLLEGRSEHAQRMRGRGNLLSDPDLARRVRDYLDQGRPDDTDNNQYILGD